jgi:hypothetical protein
MATQDIWPEVGVSVDDENGDTIPIGGLTVVWSAYYENLLREGKIKTFDPTGLNGSPSPVSAQAYDNLVIEYAPINYDVVEAIIAGHLEGIDDALADIEAALALKASTTHAASHIRAGSDEIDGDLLDVDYSPTNYTKTVAATSSHVDHLASHFKGVDNAIATEFRINEQTGTTYTLVAGDFDGRTQLRCSHASGCTVTVPSGLSVTAWRPLVIVQVGAGQVTLAESSTTIRKTDTLKTREQWSRMVLETTSTSNVYELSGDTESS